MQSTVVSRRGLSFGGITKLSPGTYHGLWTGYEVTLTHGEDHWRFKTKLRVHGTNIPCFITISDRERTIIDTAQQDKLEQVNPTGVTERILLKAALDLLQQQKVTPVTLNLLDEHVHCDLPGFPGFPKTGRDTPGFQHFCDGSTLMEYIQSLLTMDRIPEEAEKEVVALGAEIKRLTEVRGRMVVGRSEANEKIIALEHKLLKEQEEVRAITLDRDSWQSNSQELKSKSVALKAAASRSTRGCWLCEHDSGPPKHACNHPKHAHTGQDNTAYSDKCGDLFTPTAQALTAQDALDVLLADEPEPKPESPKTAVASVQVFYKVGIECPYCMNVHTIVPDTYSELWHILRSTTHRKNLVGTEYTCNNCGDNFEVGIVGVGSE